MNCPGCNKFASLETGEPEADLQVEISEDNKTAHVTGTIHIVRSSSCCGSDMKEANFDVSEEISLDGIDERAEVDDPEVESDVSTTESGGGRYKKNMIGYEGTVTVSIHWKLGKEEGDEERQIQIHDELQASAWDEMM